MRKGFTLIELLIVVAIIAILAAIAVPNFLEAQTRSKVARAVADMRTLATAVECYAVDYNIEYPFDLDSRGWPWYITDVLSTPVAYVTAASMLEDPFRMHLNQQVDSWRFRFINYKANANGTPPWPPCWCPGPTRTRWVAGTADATIAQCINQWGLWKISSAGPDRTANTSFFLADLVYDPTNGTVSEGDIIRSQKTGQRP
jgi:prepilin-type N-terminal cleavage/methylation domain-containing protein